MTGTLGELYDVNLCTLACSPRLFKAVFIYIFAQAFPMVFYLQLLSLKSGRSKMVNCNRSIWGDNLAPPTFQSSRLWNKPREPLMTSDNTQRSEVKWGKSLSKHMYKPQNTEFCLATEASLWSGLTISSPNPYQVARHLASELWVVCCTHRCHSHEECNWHETYLCT